MSSNELIKKLPPPIHALEDLKISGPNLNKTNSMKQMGGRPYLMTRKSSGDIPSMDPDSKNSGWVKSTPKKSSWAATQLPSPPPVPGQSSLPNVRKSYEPPTLHQTYTSGALQQPLGASTSPRGQSQINTGTPRGNDRQLPKVSSTDISSFSFSKDPTFLFICDQLPPPLINAINSPSNNQIQIDNVLTHMQRIQLKLGWAQMQISSQSERESLESDIQEKIKKKEELMAKIKQKKAEYTHHVETIHEWDNAKQLCQLMEHAKKTYSCIKPKVAQEFQPAFSNPAQSTNNSCESELNLYKEALNILESISTVTQVIKKENKGLETLASRMDAEYAELEEQYSKLEKEEQELKENKEKCLLITETIKKLSTTFEELNGRIASSSSLGGPVGQNFITLMQTFAKLKGELQSEEGQSEELLHTAVVEREVCEDEADIIYQSKDGVRLIKAATVDKMVERLCSPHTPDLSFQKALLLTYRSFMTPLELVRKLALRYCLTPTDFCCLDDLEKIMKKTQRPVQLRVLNVIKYWVENHRYDFVNDDVKASLASFLYNLTGPKGHANISKVILGQLFSNKPGKHTLRTIKSASNVASSYKKKSPPAIIPKVPDGVPLSIEYINTTELARQISLIDMWNYRSIPAKEFLNQSWNKKGKEVNAPNILSAIAFFNKISNWVTYEVVRTEDLNSRVERLKMFIKLAEECRALNNFNGVMEIIAGLTSSAIHRLKRTWNCLDPEKMAAFSSLKGLMDTNFTQFRAELKKCTPPCVPYLGIFLTDLIFMEEGNPDKIKGLINCNKLRLVAEKIREVQQYQNDVYVLDDVNIIQDYLNNITILDEEELYNLSLKVEGKKLNRFFGQ